MRRHHADDAVTIPTKALPATAGRALLISASPSSTVTPSSARSATDNTRERHLAATCNILSPHTRNEPSASERERKLSRFVRNATATQRHAPRCPCPLAKSAI
ncbi:MAG: hypothetical protein EOO27_06620 [Comamonadaceae bacterium]|nr:MAG: hypothetical protein EOO27_06620 [Comamonadaceae bacterium]